MIKSSDSHFIPPLKRQMKVHIKLWRTYTILFLLILLVFSFD